MFTLICAMCGVLCSLVSNFGSFVVSISQPPEMSTPLYTVELLYLNILK